LLLRIMSLVAALLLGGCQTAPLQSISYGFERGGALSDADYARLEPLVKATVWKTRLAPGTNLGTPVAYYAYSFVPGFDVHAIPQAQVQPFASQNKEGAKFAADLAPALAKALNDIGLLSVVGTANTSPSIVISGVVTRAKHVVVPVQWSGGLKLQVEAKVTSGGQSVGAIQINFVAGGASGPIVGPPAVIIGQLIGNALAPNTAELASKLISNAFIQARRQPGEREGTSAPYMPADFIPPVSAAGS